MTAEAITAPYARLKAGLGKIRGYSLQDTQDHILLAFEPDLVEAPGQNVPCLRIVFRKSGDRVVLEKFVLCDGDAETPLDLDAAHDALQAWVDWMAD